MEPKFADRMEWELTQACNLSCRNCGRADPRGRPRELETEEALAVAVELGRAGCREVTLTGGEPTLRSDWPQIAQVLSRSGVTVRLITNGRGFGRIEARLARAAGVSTVLLRPQGCGGLGQADDASLETAVAGLKLAGVDHRILDPDDHDHDAQRPQCALRADGTMTTCLASPAAQGVGNVRQSPLPHLWRAAQASRQRDTAAASAPVAVAC